MLIFWGVRSGPSVVVKFILWISDTCSNKHQVTAPSHQPSPQEQKPVNKLCWTGYAPRGEPTKTSRWFVVILLQLNRWQAREVFKGDTKHNFKWCLTFFDSWRVIEANRSWGYITTWKEMICFKDDPGKRQWNLLRKGQKVWRDYYTLSTKDTTWVRYIARVTSLHLKSLMFIVGHCIPDHFNSKNTWY